MHIMMIFPDELRAQTDQRRYLADGVLAESAEYEASHQNEDR